MSSALPVTLTKAECWRRGRRRIGPVSLTLDGPEIVAVLGPNGAGKSSLLLMLHGMLRLKRGQVAWALPWDETRKRHAFVFQKPILLRRSVIDNICYPLRLRGIGKVEAVRKADAMASRLGLTEMLSRSALMLSVGEAQKLALARALITEPEVLFLDEPCAALDGATTQAIETILQEVRQSGTKILFSTHDLGQARRLAGECVFLNKGRAEAHQAAAAFFEAPQSDAAQRYLSGEIIT